MTSFGLRMTMFMLGGAAVLSGGLKCRARARAYHGGFGLGLIEVLAGVTLMGSTAPGMGTESSMILLGSVTGGLIVVSSTLQALRAKRLRHRRHESEARRLYTRVTFGDALGGIALPEGVELPKMPPRTDAGAAQTLETPEGAAAGDEPATEAGPGEEEGHEGAEGELPQGKPPLT